MKSFWIDLMPKILFASSPIPDKQQAFHHHLDLRTTYILAKLLYLKHHFL